jgi:rhodanese-related sulfurtransferase
VVAADPFGDRGREAEFAGRCPSANSRGQPERSMRGLSKHLLIVVALLLASGPARAGVLTADQAQALAARGALTLMDVRLPSEWAETGLPAGATGVSLQNPLTHEVRAGFVDDVLRAVGGDRAHPLALICARGSRSGFARELLAEAGFTNVDDVSEGVVGGPNGPGWLARGLPTEPCRAC